MMAASTWLFWNTSVETVLRTRPMAMQLFEAAGIDPWKVLKTGLGDALTAGGRDFAAFAAALDALPIPDSESDWRSLPVYHLIDRLVDDHRAFLQVQLPAIGRALSEDVSDAASLQYLGLLAGEWPAFAVSLTAHIREEEDALFLRLLRYHSCLTLRTVDPDLEGGSVRVFGTVRLLTHGHRDLELIHVLLEKVLPVLPGPSRPQSPLEAQLRILMDAFHRQLVAHAHLESHVLFPRALEMEKELLDRMIRGDRLAASGVTAGA